MEEGLGFLLAVIRGEVFFPFLGKGIHVYPNGDARNQKIYAGCLKLEALGLVTSRPIDNHLFFEPTPETIH